MPLLPVNVLQPPLPFLPPRLSSAIHWLIRVILLIGTIFTFPFFLVYIPISISLPQKNAILHLHPHNLPPCCSFMKACGRGYWAYGASGFLWSVTSIGLAPDFGLGVSRWLAKRGLDKAERVARSAGLVLEGRLVVSEDTIPPLAMALCIGALDGNDLVRNSVHCFWLDHIPISEALDSKPGKTRKVILWLAGGGYVSGHPLNDRPIFSLARNLPSGYRILAPSITRALSLERSFPVSLLDGLASYAYLRKAGYEAKDITLIGNSAGGGLSWSILSYLVAIDQAGIGSLGVPRAVAMVSVGHSIVRVSLTEALVEITAGRCWVVSRFRQHATAKECCELLPRAIPRYFQQLLDLQGANHSPRLVQRVNIRQPLVASPTNLACGGHLFSFRPVYSQDPRQASDQDTYTLWNGRVVLRSRNRFC